MHKNLKTEEEAIKKSIKFQTKNNKQNLKKLNKTKLCNYGYNSESFTKELYPTNKIQIVLKINKEKKIN